MGRREAAGGGEEGRDEEGLEGGWEGASPWLRVCWRPSLRPAGVCVEERRRAMQMLDEISRGATGGATSEQDSRRRSGAGLASGSLIGTLGSHARSSGFTQPQAARVDYWPLDFTASGIWWIYRELGCKREEGSGGKGNRALYAGFLIYLFWGTSKQGGKCQMRLLLTSGGERKGSQRPGLVRARSHLGLEPHESPAACLEVPGVDLWGALWTAVLCFEMKGANRVLI